MIIADVALKGSDPNSSSCFSSCLTLIQAQIKYLDECKCLEITKNTYLNITSNKGVGKLSLKINNGKIVIFSLGKPFFVATLKIIQTSFQRFIQI